MSYSGRGDHSSRSTGERKSQRLSQRHTSPVETSASTGIPTTSSDRIKLSSSATDSQSRASTAGSNTTSVTLHKSSQGSKYPGTEAGKRGSNGNKGKSLNSNRQVLDMDPATSKSNTSPPIRHGARSHVTVPSKHIPKAEKVTVGTTPPTSPSPFYHHTDTFKALPSYPDVPAHKQHHDNRGLGPEDPTPPPTSLAFTPRPPDSPFNSGNISSGDLNELHQQATPSFGSTVRVVGSEGSFECDKKNMKVRSAHIPRLLNTDTPLSHAPTSVGGAGGGVYSAHIPRLLNTDTPLSHAPTSVGGAGVYSAPAGADTAVSGSELAGGGVSVYSHQTDGDCHSAQGQAGSTTDTGNSRVVLPERSIGVDVLKGAGLKGAGLSGRQVESRPCQEQLCTGKGHHQVVAGSHVNRDVNSLGPTGQLPRAKPAGGDQSQIALLQSKRDAMLKELKTDRNQRIAAEIGDNEGEEGPMSVHDQQAGYNYQRHVMSECKRLQGVEKEADKLREELTTCRKEKEYFENEVMELTKRLSCHETSGKGEVDESEEMRALRVKLQKSEANVKKLKEHVNRVTKPTLLGEDGLHSLSSSSLEGAGPAEGAAEEGLKQRLHTSQLPKPSGSGGRSFGAQHEEELASLYQEMKKKDKLIENQARQLGKLEEVAKNIAALMAHNKESSATITSLNEKCEHLQATTYVEDFNQERKDREKAHSKMAEMENQYARQFQKLTEQLEVSQQHSEQKAEGLGGQLAGSSVSVQVPCGGQGEGHCLATGG